MSREKNSEESIKRSEPAGVDQSGRPTLLYTPLTKKALRIAARAHKDQTDKTGLPYILHPVIAATGVEGEYETCAALLHDVVEDTDVTLDDLREEGMPEEVLDALSLLTHIDGVPYMDYVAAIKQNHVARAVKLADLSHNMQLERLDEVTEEDLERLEMYKAARALLLAD